MQGNQLSFLNDLVKKRSGIDLSDDKRYLYESRLLPLVGKYGFRDLQSFIHHLMYERPREELLQVIVEAMTTNESMFFRDNKPFDWLKTIILPELVAKKPGQPLSLWSAACSSGQEAYSVAMLAEENRPLLQQNTLSIVGTDIDTQILSRAREGIYNQFEAQRGLPMPLLIKYFDQLPDQRWQVKSFLREMVSFTPHNLLQPARHMGPIDIVLCRNVLIYFDEPTKMKALSNIAEAMPAGGYLLLGSAETMPAGVGQFLPHAQQRQIFVRQ